MSDGYKSRIWVIKVKKCAEVKTNEQGGIKTQKQAKVWVMCKQSYSDINHVQTQIKVKKQKTQIQEIRLSNITGKALVIGECEQKSSYLHHG